MYTAEPVVVFRVHNSNKTIKATRPGAWCMNWYNKKSQTLPKSETMNVETLAVANWRCMDPTCDWDNEVWDFSVIVLTFNIVLFFRPRDPVEAQAFLRSAQAQTKFTATHT